MEDVRYARVKGGYRLHRKVFGQWKALCGHEPGTAGKARRMRDRTGWATYVKDYAPSGMVKVCEDCLRIEREEGTSKPLAQSEG